MAVRAVEAPKPAEPMRSRCKCGALLEFERSDVRYGFQRPGESIGHITCPHCKNDHYFDTSTLEARVKPGTCNYCGMPENSAACQQSHP